jgi:CRISPR-associated protein Cas2
MAFGRSAVARVSHDPLTEDLVRRCYLVCYDIRDPKRLRRVHRVIKDYGEPWQFSVFYCRLRDIDRVRLDADLREVADLRVDSILILDLGTKEWDAREAVTTLGAALPEPESHTIII